jgi:hypothetical protein
MRLLCKNGVTGRRTGLFKDLRRDALNDALNDAINDALNSFKRRTVICGKLVHGWFRRRRTANNGRKR